MSANSVPLTHDEIWDDSVLIESWNEALAEYQKYHSIHARGGGLEALQVAETASGLTQAHVDPGDAEHAARDASLAMDGMPATAPRPEAPTLEGEGVAGGYVDGRVSTNEEAPPAGEGPILVEPQAVLGSVGDPGLKKMLMSWYYAGYYTGLYEGQQSRQDS